MISKIFVLLLVFQTTNIKSKLGNSYTLNERKGSQEISKEETKDEKVEADSPIFSWCGPHCMIVEFPDGDTDRITLTNVDAADEINACIFDGTFDKDTSASVVISGCQNDPNVYITVYSNHLKNRKMFNINEGIIEEPVDPYEEDCSYLEDVSVVNRLKRETYVDEDYTDDEDEFKDYIEEYYDELEYGGNVDFTPPPVLILNIRLSFEETMRSKLGSELASQSYIRSVLAHTRKHLQHTSLGAKIELNIVGSIEFVPNRHFAPTSQHMEEAKMVKKNEPWPTIFFCHTDDTNDNTGIAFTRQGCHPQKAVAIVKHRKDVNVAAITMSHEIGHLLGQKHDSKEDKPDASSKACSRTGIMSSRVDPAIRPAEWSLCSAYRFGRWFKRTGKACLLEPGGKNIQNKQ